jgi:hypothetical protein
VIDAPPDSTTKSLAPSADLPAAWVATLPPIEIVVSKV